MFFLISTACVAAATFSTLHAFHSPALAWPAGTKNIPTTEMTDGKPWASGEACDRLFHGIDARSYYMEDKKLEDKGQINAINMEKKMMIEAGYCDCNNELQDNCDKFNETWYKARFLGIFPDGDDW